MQRRLRECSQAQGDAVSLQGRGHCVAPERFTLVMVLVVVSSPGKGVHFELC